MSDLTVKMSTTKANVLVFCLIGEVVGTYNRESKEISISLAPTITKNANYILLNILEEIQEIENNPEYFMRFLI